MNVPAIDDNKSYQMGTAYYYDTAGTPLAVLIGVGLALVTAGVVLTSRRRRRAGPSRTG